MIPRAAVDDNTLTDFLDADSVLFWLREIRGLEGYHPNNHPDLETTLNSYLEAAINALPAGDVRDVAQRRARTINAARKLIESKGSGQERFNSPDGARWSRADQRREFVLDVLHMLYDAPIISGTITSRAYEFPKGRTRGADGTIVSSLDRLIQ